MSEEPFNETTARNIRNGLIDYFELLSSREEILRYRANLSDSINIMSEIINQWDDWFHSPGGKDIDRLYPDPVYTAEERASLLAYEAVIEAVAPQTPDHDLHAFLESHLFLELSAAAREALETFLHRGRSPIG